MPLSEHEEKMLAQMERALLEDDPSFASRLQRHSRPRPSRRNTVVGIAAVVGGLALVIVAAMQSMPLIGGVGFLVMVLGGALMSRPEGGSLGVVDGDGTVRPATTRPTPSRRRTQGTFMQRLEERWERRRTERW